MFNSNQNIQLGLVAKDSAKKIKETKLLKLQIDVKITNNISQTILTQEFANQTDETLVINYNFPINLKSCLQGIEFESGGKIMKGVVKEKKTAKTEYKDNLKSNNQVIYAAINKNHPNMMVLKLGNLFPKQQIKIRFTLCEELAVCLNKFWLYKIPTNIISQYHYQKQVFSKDQAMLKENEPNDQKSQQQIITLQIECFEKIVFAKSPSHNISVISVNDEKTLMKIQVSEQEFHKSADNFVFLYATEKIHQPNSTLGIKNGQIYAMLSFIPNFNNMEAEDAFKAQLASQANISDSGNFEPDFASSMSEFIFFLDRSGSMNGQKIEKAKEALILFLKSLPPGSFFNIVSFGSDFNIMYQKSVSYTNENVENAVKLISKMKADMGGTDVYPCLSKILDQKRINKMPKLVYLLTDGMVVQEEFVLQIIDQNSDSARFFAIGIGNDVSRDFLMDCAEKGKGKALIIADNGDLQGQIIHLLQQSLTSYLDQFTFEFDNQLVDSVIPSPQNIPYILKNEPFTVYIQFKKDITTIDQINTVVALTCYDSHLKSNLNYKIQVSRQTSLLNNTVCDLSINKMIKILEKNEQMQNSKVSLQNDIYLSKQIKIDDEIKDLSIKNQILSKKTAFFMITETQPDDIQQFAQHNKQEKIELNIGQEAEDDEEDEEEEDEDNNFEHEGSIYRNRCRGRGGKGGFGKGGVGKGRGANLYSRGGQHTNETNCRYSQTLMGLPTLSAGGYQAFNIREIPSKIKSPNQSRSKSRSRSNSKSSNESDSESGSKSRSNKKFFSSKLISQNKDRNEKLIQQNAFMEIVKMQQVDGSWNYNIKILSLLNLQEKFFLDSVPQAVTEKLNLNKAYLNYWITYIIILWFQACFPDKKSQWSIISTKAQQWIQSFKLNISQQDSDKIKSHLQIN